MDKQIESYISSLKEEFNLQTKRNIINFQLMQNPRTFPTTAVQYPHQFKLRSDKYAEWRYSVKAYVNKNYENYDIAEILELLDMPEISEKDADRLIGLLSALANLDEPNMTSNKEIDKQSVSGVFISHSSEDKEFVIKVVDFFEKIGVDSSAIFCSSIEGQGVKNNERIEEAVRNKLISSKLLFYVITKNFLNSNYCMQELGAGWILRDTRICGKKVFILKLDDVKPIEISGFVNADFKYSELNQESLTELIDDISEVFEIPNRKAADNNKLCKLLLEQTKTFIDNAVQQADLNEQEKNRILKEKLIKSVAKLTTTEKSIIAQIYFSDEKCIDLEYTSGLTAQLVEKLYIRRLTSISSIGFMFPYGLQPWIAEYIDSNPKFRAALKRLYNQQCTNPY